MAYVRAHDTKRTERGRVVKRYEVVYRAKLRTDDGRIVTRLRQETHPTKAAADARAAELNARKHRRAVDPAEQRARGNRTFDDWASDWIATQQTKVALGKLKQSTADDYAKLLNRYVLPELGAEAIADIDALAIDRFMASLSVQKTRSGAPLNPKTVKHAWNVLRWVLAYATRKDALEVNPIAKTEFSADRGSHSTGDHEDFEPHPLTGDQLGALCAALRGELPGRDGQPLPAYPVYALMVEFMANTGLRASEVSGLEIADVTFSPALAGQTRKATVTVRRTKKRRGGDWVIGTPKSKRSTNRVVPLPGWLAAKLADYLADVHPRGNPQSPAKSESAPLWPGRANQAARAGMGAAEWLTALDWSEPVEMGTFYRRTFARALAVVGLPVTTPARPARERKTASGEIVTEPARDAVAGVRLHDLRHTAAVAWLQAGVNVVQVSRWLGHAQPTVTMNVYGDWVPDEAENPLPEPKSVTNVVALPNRTG